MYFPVCSVSTIRNTGRIPFCNRCARTKDSDVRHCLAISLSLKPISLASASTEASPRWTCSFSSILTIFRIDSKKSFVIMVSSCKRSMLSPRRSNSATAKIPSSLNSLRYCSSCSVLKESNFASRRWKTPVSSDRTLFSMHSSRLEPMPMTSPVAFICVPRVFGASGNLSKGKRGNFATI